MKYFLPLILLHWLPMIIFGQNSPNGNTMPYQPFRWPATIQGDSANLSASFDASSGVYALRTRRANENDRIVLSRSVQADFLLDITPQDFGGNGTLGIRLTGGGFYHEWLLYGKDEYSSRKSDTLPLHDTGKSKSTKLPAKLDELSLLRIARVGGVLSLQIAPSEQPLVVADSLTAPLLPESLEFAFVVYPEQRGNVSFEFFNARYYQLRPDTAQPAQVISLVETIDINTGIRTVVYQHQGRMEAPNWMPDGKSLITNSGGLLYQVPLDGKPISVIPTGHAQFNNNDHGISPDGTMIAISHHNGQQPNGDNSTVYIVPITGGNPRQVTFHSPSYWHGWSPDGQTLAFVGRRNGVYNIYTVSVNGGIEEQLTRTDKLDDGPDYSPDGKYIFFNSARTGTMLIWRMRPDGNEQISFTSGPYQDWFPHPSPDGKWLAFVSYLPDVPAESHPPDKHVMLRLLDSKGGTPRTLTHLYGGQGTINVPSWSPDSQKFAFVSYTYGL